LDQSVPPLLRKLLSSVAVIGAAAALPLFAAVGSFGDGTDPFPHSVQAAVQD
jgi:hypothetical protein